MYIISVNIGKPQTVHWKDKSYITSIFKHAVSDQCYVGFQGINGDEQADVKHHGGETKAIYSYDIEHYDYWKKMLKKTNFQHGMFGENLTTKGLPDGEVKIGNIYKVGTTIIKAMEPRFPCSMLNVRFNLSTMVKLFTQQQRSGIYFKVMEEGLIQPNDTITLIETSPYNITITDIVTCYYSKGKNRQLLQSILDIPYLPDKLRKNLTAFV